MIDSLVVAGVFSNLQEAENASAALRGNGIPSQITNQGILRSDWLNPKSTSGVKLQVRQADAERAEEILSLIAEGFDLGEIATIDVGPQEDPADKCQRCGSDEIRRTPRLLVAFLITTIFAGFLVIGEYGRWPLFALLGMSYILVFLANRWRCGVCGAPRE